MDRSRYYAILLSLTQLPELSWTGPTGLLHSKNLGAEPFPPLSSTMRTRSSKLTDGSESSPGTLSRISSNGLDRTLRDKTECLGFKSKESTPLALYRHAFQLEQIARYNHMKIAYTDIGEMNQVSGSDILMSTICLKKSEVVESCLGHYLFPPKSTRHLIPSRPLGIGVPLGWLKNPNVEEAEAEFEKYLAAKRVRRLPEGSMVGSRRYMEEVFLFE